MKTINGHTRYVLEALEHKITPRVGRIKELLEELSKNVYTQMTCHKIKKEIVNLEKAVTRLILKEMKRDRKKCSGRS